MTPDPEPATRAERRRAAEAAAMATAPKRDVVRTVARGLGQTLISLGVVVLLFVVYEVYVTDIFSAAKQDTATEKLDEAWQTASVTETSAVTESAVVTVSGDAVEQLVQNPATRTPDYPVAYGDGFAKIYIPAFGSDYSYTIIEGTDPDDLDTGPGHYPDTQLPGEQGNFAIAGHRVSKGSPFNELGLLSSCDALVVETKSDWFVYRVLPMENEVQGWSAAGRANCADVAPLGGEYEGVYGREITVPSDYAQVLPVPHVESMEVPADAERIITLTTCHPQFSDAERMIVHGVLVKSYAKKAGFTPPELAEG
ncbi:class E sortase [Nakamurella sp. YIM 132087]|uniref:Class E sortase n=2 Tax=Nakamurella alba TaxID=2665158 RepID=A0A7K1FKX7_9ACTN|nr:class E sortase [Nakamurella alba]